MRPGWGVSTERKGVSSMGMAGGLNRWGGYEKNERINGQKTNVCSLEMGTCVMEG